MPSSLYSGGGRGIRTPGGREPTAVFKTAALDRSAIPPYFIADSLSMERSVGPSQRRIFYHIWGAAQYFDIHAILAPMSHIARSSLIIAFFFGIDKVLAFVRQIFIARQFGLGVEIDAFNAANNIPDLLSALISGGLGLACCRCFRNT
jgi:hypothetical protein